MKFRKKILLFKIQTAPDVDAVPTGAANAILTHNLEIMPLEGTVVKRNVDRAHLGNDLSIHVGTHVKCSFEVELAGAGAAAVTAGTPPPYGPLLRACAWSELSTATQDTQYDPVDKDEEMGTAYIHLDGQKHAMLNCRGNVGFGLSPEGIPRYKFDFMGLWVDPAAVVDPTTDTSAFQVPKAVTNQNTPTFIVHGASYNVYEWNYDHGNKVEYKNVVGEESVEIVDREPKGSITIEAPPLGTKNWFTTIKNNIVADVQIIHGTETGDIVQFDAPQVQLLAPKYGEKKGIRTLKMDTSFIPDAGADEVKLTIR